MLFKSGNPTERTAGGKKKKKKKSYYIISHLLAQRASKPKCHAGQQEFACPDPLAFYFKVQCCDQCGALSPAALTPADHAL